MTLSNIDMTSYPCKCCGLANMHEEFFGILKTLNAALLDIGWKLCVNSGARCVRHNAEVGGVKNSRHMRGEAVDLSIISPSFVTPQMLADFVDEKLGVDGKYPGGLGVYSWGIHIDCGRTSRWNG